MNCKRNKKVNNVWKFDSNKILKFNNLRQKENF